MNKEIEEAIAYLIETANAEDSNQMIDKITGYIYGLLDTIKMLK